MATIEVMYNGCYGGFGFSEEAQQMYEAQGGTAKGRAVPRHDTLMIRILKELGPERANKQSGNILFVIIPARFADFYSISDYDGMETVVIEHDLYRAETAKDILKDESLSLAERVLRATEVLEEPFNDAILNEERGASD